MCVISWIWDSGSHSTWLTYSWRLASSDLCFSTKIKKLIFRTIFRGYNNKYMKYTLGIDVGGTKIAAGLVDKAFKVHQVRVLATSQTNLPAQLIKLIENFRGFSAIGLGVPSPDISADGMVRVLPNVKGFKKTNLKKL